MTWLTSEGGTFLRLATNGASRLSIDSSGRVGIGIDQADRLLHLKGSGLEVVFEDAGAAPDNRKWRIITGGNTFVIDTVNDALTQAVPALIAYRSGINLTALAIPNCGLGVGTPSPAAPLHVKSPSSELLRLESLSTDVYLWLYSSGGCNSISMDGNGNIYVGGFGANRIVHIRTCNGGWGVQAKFDGLNNRIHFYFLPSSPTGLPSGAIWYDPADGNRLKYVP